VVAAIVRAGEGRILTIERNRSDGPFDAVAVEFDTAVIEEADETVPASGGIADRFGKRALAADPGELGIEEAAEFFDDRSAALLTASSNEKTI
jgi:hypothetical protein